MTRQALASAQERIKIGPITLGVAGQIKEGRVRVKDLVLRFPVILLETLEIDRKTVQACGDCFATDIFSQRQCS